MREHRRIKGPLNFKLKGGGMGGWGGVDRGGEETVGAGRPGALPGWRAGARVPGPGPPALPPLPPALPPSWPPLHPVPSIWPPCRAPDSPPPPPAPSVCPTDRQSTLSVWSGGGGGAGRDWDCVSRRLRLSVTQTLCHPGCVRQHDSCSRLAAPRRGEFSLSPDRTGLEEKKEGEEEEEKARLETNDLSTDVDRR